MCMAGTNLLFYCLLFYQRRIEIGEMQPLSAGRYDQFTGPQVRIKAIEFVSDGNGNGGRQLHEGIILRKPGGSWRARSGHRWST